MDETNPPAAAPRWSEAMVGALTQNSTDIISLLDAQGRLLYNSSATERINGYRPEELVGVDTFEFMHPDDRAAVIATFQAVLATPGEVHTVQYRYRTKAGGWLWMEAVACNQLENPDVRGIVANTRDISARRQAEEERARLEAQLLRARHLDSLGVLAGGMAHDFNNLLSVVLGEASLLRVNSSPAEVRVAADNIEAAARKAADITQLLLACAGQGRFSRSPLSLPALVAKLEPELRQSVRRDATLEVTVDPLTPLVDAADERLRQVLRSLVLNASEALSGPGGRVQVRVGAAHLDAAALRDCTLVQGLEPGPAVFLEVSDTGCGMSAETVQHIFDPFFTTKQTGRGLGLAAVAGIVKGFLGGIGVRSTLGGGSTLTVWLAPSNSAPVAGPPQVEGWRGHGLVLVVDDEPATAKVACRLLESLGFETATATDGADALARFGASLDRLRLVLLDMVMPRLDGPQTFARMRALRADLPVTFYSGYEVGGAQPGLRAPGTAFLQKPFTRSALAACVRSLLDAQSLDVK